MKTRGAIRKKPSHRKPGAAHASVTQLPPRSRCAPRFSPSARSCSCSTSSSSSSMSARSRCGGGSGVEELDILLFPHDADGLALAAPKGRIPVAGHLRQHPFTARSEVQLDKVAEELDEHDLAVGRVQGLFA